jgi:hypothetical protein
MAQNFLWFLGCGDLLVFSVVFGFARLSVGAPPSWTIGLCRRLGARVEARLRAVPLRSSFETGNSRKISWARCPKVAILCAPLCSAWKITAG